jgi:hypothetical protein
MRPEVQVLPGPRILERILEVRDALGGIVRKPVVLVIGVMGVVVTMMRRRQSHADAELWREATSDSSR